jgi:hypothetical protein
MSINFPRFLLYTLHTGIICYLLDRPLLIWFAACEQCNDIAAHAMGYKSHLQKIECYVSATMQPFKHHNQPLKQESKLILVCPRAQLQLLSVHEQKAPPLEN